MTSYTHVVSLYYESIFAAQFLISSRFFKWEHPGEVNICDCVLSHMIFHSCIIFVLLMTITIYFYGWLCHLVFLGFVSWVSLILCFADSFCFVKSVPAGIPELGVFHYFRSILIFPFHCSYVSQIIISAL